MSASISSNPSVITPDMVSSFKISKVSHSPPDSLIHKHFCIIKLTNGKSISNVMNGFAIHLLIIGINRNKISGELKNFASYCRCRLRSELRLPTAQDLLTGLFEKARVLEQQFECQRQLGNLKLS